MRLDVAACVVEVADTVAEDIGDGRVRLASGRVLDRREVTAARVAAALIARAGVARR